MPVPAPMCAGTRPARLAAARSHLEDLVIALLTILVAFPLGFFLRHRLTACVAYGLAFAHVFTWQTASLLMEWTKGGYAAFPQDAGTGDSISTMPWGYLSFTTVVYAAGFGLVTLGHWARSRRAGRRSGVDLAAARG